MKVKLQTFYSGQGDCIFFSLNEGEESYNILIDCGKYSGECRKTIDKYLDSIGWHINLLIVTHIDSDHILGLISLLDKNKELKIDEIWFNSYKRDSEEEKRSLTPSERETLKSIYSRLKVAQDIAGDQISASEAMSLSELILSKGKEECSQGWRWRREYITSCSDDVSIKGGRFGTITFLTPTEDALKDLEKEFENAFIEGFYADECPELLEGESVYECLMRMISERDKELIEEKVSSIESADRLKEAANAPVLPVSIHNKASIAFVYEYNGHRFLFTGDAAPEVLCNSLQAKYKDESPILFDFIKVPHHGSAHSMTKELASLIDSEEYFFTGGQENKRPSAECVGRILHADVGGDGKKRKLHFNSMTSFVEELRSSEEIKNLYGVEIDTDCNCYEAEI